MRRLTAYEKRLLTRAVYERGALAYLDVVRSVGESPEQRARASSTCTRNSAPRGPRCGSRPRDGGVLAAVRAGGVLSLDWHAPGAEMRIQVDRVFADASGAIASLEITDVLADQAEQYVGVHSNKF